MKKLFVLSLWKFSPFWKTIGPSLPFALLSIPRRAHLVDASHEHRGEDHEVHGLRPQSQVDEQNRKRKKKKKEDVIKQLGLLQKKVLPLLPLETPFTQHYLFWDSSGPWPFT